MSTIIDDMTEDNPLDLIDRAAAIYAPEDTATGILTGFARLLELVEADVMAHVEVARLQGVSWTDIGKALGVSRQAAHRRFSPAMQYVSEEAFTHEARRQGMSEQFIADALNGPSD